MSIFNIDLQDDEGNSYRPMAHPDSQTEFTKAGSRTNIASGDSFRTAWGKICKFFADLGTSAFSGLANNLTTTAAGYGMDARQGPVIQQKFDQINSNLGGFTPIIDDTGRITGYRTTAGADTVFPFKKAPINLGSSNIIDVSQIYEDYTSLTIDNFIIAVTGASGKWSETNGSSHNNVTATININKNYNSATGRLTFNTSAKAYGDGGNDYFGAVVCSITTITYLVL